MKAEMGELNYKDFLKKHNMVDSFDSFAVWNHQQAIIDDLKTQLNNMEACYIEKKKQGEDQQKRIDEVLQEVKGLERFTGEDCIADFDVLRGAVSHACKRLEKTLRGDHE